MIAAIMPPGVVFGHTATVERAPHRRPDRTALVLCAILNSHAFDWLVRLKAGTHLSLYILEGLPMPALDMAAEGFLAEGALRLSANHGAYAALWREQTGRRWTPDVALADQGTRWRLRAAMDAVVARAYGLDRAAYQRVLAGFTHRSFPDAPRWCLEAFDSPAAGMPAIQPPVTRARQDRPPRDMDVSRTVMAGHVPATHALAVVQPPRRPHRSGAGGRDTPGHDGEGRGEEP